MTNVQLIDACAKSAQEQVEWHKARMPALTTERLEDFRSGYADGWRAAVSYLKLHGALKVTE
jgi:hypothetical protein